MMKPPSSNRNKRYLSRDFEKLKFKELNRRAANFCGKTEAETRAVMDAFISVMLLEVENPRVLMIELMDFGRFRMFPLRFGDRLRWEFRFRLGSRARRILRSETTDLSIKKVR